jgi:dihydroorotase
MLDLVVEGNAYLDGRLDKCCIGIENGKIVAIKKILKGDKYFDFGDKLILPAGMDIHVHFRDPGYTDKEDFKTGTMAAAFGGISYVMDMPNTKPPVISKNTVLDKLEHISKKAHIDYGIYSSLTARTKIKKTAEICSGFKIYLANTTGDLLFSDERLLPRTLTQINILNKIPAIHAESEKIITQNRLKQMEPKNLHDHLCFRPNEAEEVAISILLEITSGWAREDISKSEDQSDLTQIDKIEDTKPKERLEELEHTSKFGEKDIEKHIHICHLSTAQGVQLLRERFQQFKKSYNFKSIKITSEVTPHHLLLNEKYKGGAFGKVNPPLRTIEDQNMLWSALSDGTIEILASDHAPHLVEEKTEEFTLAPSGVPGVETMFPLMLSLVKHNKLKLKTLTSAISTAPAELFHLPKGKLQEGYDGDLIVIDFYKEKPIKAKTLHSKCGWTPFENMDAIFPTFMTVRGNITVKNGNLEVDPGVGKFYN